MPLASKDGKLYFKTVTEIVDGEEVEVRKLCSSCCGGDPPPGPGAGCYLPCEEVLSTTGSTPDDAIEEVRRLFEGSEGITGTPEDYGLEVKFIDCLDIGGGVQICSAGVFCCGGLADMDSPQCGSLGETPPACGNFDSEEEFNNNPYGTPLQWYPGKDCSDPSINCDSIRRNPLP